MAQLEDRLAWITLTRAPGLDAPVLSTALETLGQAAGLMSASDSQRARAGISEAAREFLRSAAAGPTPAEVAWAEQPSHHILPFTDSRFPRLLRSPAPPIALYVAGSVDALSDPQLSMVGSRNPTAQGRDTAFAFAEYLAQRGLAITSGMAEGIDTAAHRGALAGQGLTIAVLGTGLDITYPRSNVDLARQIEQCGALVSEFPLGTQPKRGNFPQRNRIIAGLSLGTLVVEAARRSGSLITARYAGEQGREVFAIPGSIHNPLSRGCHQLIRQGAKLTETADDILSELNFSAFFAGVPAAGAPAGEQPESAAVLESGMDKDHKILLDALGFDPVDLDALIVRTGFKPEAVSSMMLILELEGHVQAAPGGRYSRVVRSRR
jgi:DNA processing protein